MRNKKNTSALLLQHENFKLEKITFVYFFVLFMLVLLNTVEARISCRYICSDPIMDADNTQICPAVPDAAPAGSIVKTSNIFTATIDSGNQEDAIRNLHTRLYDARESLTSAAINRRVR